MDKTLLIRLAALEYRVADTREAADMTDAELLAILGQELGYVPTIEEFMRMSAGEAEPE